MKRIILFCLLVFGLILSWTLVYAGNSNVIPTKKNNYAPVAKTGQTKSYRTHDDVDLENWNTAIDYAAELYDDCTSCFGTGGDCGLSDGSSEGDWRLPNRNEFLSLINLAYDNPALSNAAGTGKWSEGDPFNGVDMQSTNYWSSSTHASHPGIAWYVAFRHGLVYYSSKSFAYYVWCVRGGN